jgi:hypothetical protein
MKARKIAMILFAAAICGAAVGLWVETQTPGFAAAAGGTYYVSPTGSMFNAGTQTSPWPSVAWALVKVGGGNTIILEPGTYGPILVPRGYGGTSAHPTVIQSQAKWQAVIDGTLDPAVEGLASETPLLSDPTHHNANYVTFDGLKVVKAGTFGINLGGDWNVAENCWVTGSALSGIGSWGHSHITLLDNLVENDGTSTRFDHGIYLSGNWLVVTGNIVRHNSGCGITTTSYILAPSTISGNLVYDNLANLLFEGDTGSLTLTNNILLAPTNNPSLIYDIDGIRVYGTDVIGVWSGNRVECSISGSSLDGIESNNMADYSTALSRILPLAPTAQDRTAPTATVTDSGPYNSDQMVMVTYIDNQSLNLAKISPNNVIIKGPGGYSAAPQAIAGMQMSKNSRTLVVMYDLAAPAGGWTSAKSGKYTVYLQANQISDLAGNYALPGKLAKSFVIHIDPATAQARVQKQNPLSIGPAGPTGLDGPPGRASSGRSGHDGNP